MKKKLLVLSVLALSGLGVAGLASCNTLPTQSKPLITSSALKTLSGIQISGGKALFAVGDTFNKGSLVVTANYSDNTTLDVTSSATIDSSKVDFSKPGTYSVTVSYEGKSATYNVEVKQLELKGIEVTLAKKEYHYGDVLSSADLSVKAIYNNPVDNSEVKSDLDSDDYSVLVKNSAGESVEVLTDIGQYKVEVSYNNLKKEEAINVVAYNFSKIADAINCALSGEKYVAKGSIKSTMANEDYSSEVLINYLYGKSYVKYEESAKYGNYETSGDPIYVIENKNEAGQSAYVSITDPESGDPYKNNVTVDPKATKGIEIDVLGGTNYSYGAAEIVKSMYDLIGTAGVCNVKESVGKCSHLGDAEGYLFSFNYYSEYYGSYLFSKMSLEFTLSAAGAIDKVYMSKDDYGTYDSLDSIPEDANVVVEKKTDLDGIEYYEFTIKEGATATKNSTVTVSQEVGAKAADSEIPFDISKAFYTSFDIKVNNEVAEDGKEFNLDIDNGSNVDGGDIKRIQYSIELANILPASDNYFDSIDVSLTGTTNSGYVLSGDFSDYSYAFVSYWGTSGSVTFKQAGTYTLKVSSAYCSKTYSFKVSEQAPVSLDAQVYDGESSGFVSANNVEIFTTNDLYVNALIDSMFTQGYTASLADGTQNATLVEHKILDTNCYKFNATAPGTYEITLTGAKPDCEGGVAAKTVITVVVKEVPNVAQILCGEKEANVNGTKYSVVFTKNAETDLEGSLTLTAKDDSTKTETLSFSYDAAKGFTLNHTSGSELGFDLALSSKYVLQLVDSNGNKYEIGEISSDQKPSEGALSGKYSAKFSFMGMNMTYEATFEGSNVTVCIPESSSKSGLYAYVVGADGVIALTLAEGTDVKGNHVLVLKDGKLYLNTFGNGTLVEFTKEGGSTGGETPEVAIHENFLGTWKNNFSVSVTFDANNTTNIFYDDYYYSVESCDATTLVLVDNSDPSYKITFTYDSVTGTIKDVNDAVFTKQGGSTGGEETPEVVIHENFIGTWDDGDGFIVAVTSSSVTVDGLEYNVVVCDETTLVVASKSDASYRMEFTYSNGTLTDNYSSSYTKVEDDSNADMELSGKYSAKFSFMGMNMTYEATFEGSNVTVCIPESSSKSGLYAYVVGADGVIALTLAEGTDVKGNHVLVLKDGKLYLNTFGNGTLVEFTKEGGSTGGETPEVAIHENFLGTWKNNFSGSVTFDANNTTNIFYEDYYYSVESCDATTLVLVDNSDPSYKITFTYDSVTGTIKDVNDAVFTKQSGSTGGEETPEVVIHENFLGTWVCDGMSITIDANTTAIQFGKRTLTIVYCSEAQLICIVNEDTSNRFCFSYTAEPQELTDSDGNKYIKDNASGNTDSQADEATMINEVFIGTWADGSYIYNISATEVEYLGTILTVVSCDSTTLVLSGPSGRIELVYNAKLNAICENGEYFYYKK